MTALTDLHHLTKNVLKSAKMTPSMNHQYTTIITNDRNRTAGDMGQHPMGVIKYGTSISVQKCEPRVSQAQ